MNNDEKIVSRRKALGWLSVIGVGAAAGGALLMKEEAAPKTVQFLTQDGRLVSVSEANVTKTGIKATNQDLQEWVSKK